MELSSYRGVEYPSRLKYSLHNLENEKFVDP